jgi:hypothetical protein
MSGVLPTAFLSLQGQNELDGAASCMQNKTRMIFYSGIRQWCGCGTAALALGGAMILSSCEEKAPAAPAAGAEQPAAAEAPAAPAEAAAPAADELAAAREALFNHAVYTLGQKVTSPEAFPQLNTISKDMLELLSTYYAALQKGEPSEERVRLALQIAATTRDLGAHSKAYTAYEQVLKEVELLPEEQRSSAVCRRMLSSCHNGMGVCLLAQGKAAEALVKYEAALEIDEALYKAVAPVDGTELPEGDVDPKLSQAATDLLDSYRCLGDCQRAVDDPEEAHSTYMKGKALAERLKRLSSDMSISFAKLLTSLGNLDNSLGKPKEALGSWLMAAKICQSLNASSPKLEVKAETKRCFEALVPAINSVGSQLQAAQQEAAKKAEEEKAAAEKAAAEQAAADEKAAQEAAARLAAAEQQAAEQAAAEQAEAEQKAAQEAAEKRVRNRRRRK